MNWNQIPNTFSHFQISSLNPSTIGMGVLVLIIGLTLRIGASFLAVSFGDISIKERLFVSLAWLPKATVQAAIGPLALDNAKLLSSGKIWSICWTNLEDYFNLTFAQFNNQDWKLFHCQNILDFSDREDKAEMIAYGEIVLTIAVLVILITAPIGAIAIRLSGPKWLNNGSNQKEDNKDVEKVSIYWTF